MTAEGDSRQFASAAQRRATSPATSAWVEANAGTGKTKVLTDRVARLLLSEVRPERILCLTFTKAAAAEMRNRLAGQLGRWALADNATLDDEITRLIDRRPEEEERTIARRLFARVLDAPGGINILTIHAFCQALLKRFPLEASVAPGFEVLDEGDAATLLSQSKNDQMEALARTDAPAPLREALATVAGRVSMAEYTELMAKLLGERAWLLSHFNDEAGVARERARLAKALGVGATESEAGILSSACADTAFDAKLLRTAALALAKGGKSDAERSEGIVRWLDRQEAARADDLDGYCKAFFTQEGRILARLATKAALQEMPTLVEVLRVEAERIASVLDRANGAALVERTMALLRLGLDIVERYARAKRRRGALDYDDLIVATRRLLERADSAAWVLYKLDGGIDHVLVDEAQDTNPDQWEVISRLTEEFFAGTGAVDRNRTIFAVGDTKQSIFSFQRADPHKLKEMRETFLDRTRAIERELRQVHLEVSFRSTKAVLDAVDWIFAGDEAAKGVADAGEVVHITSREGQPGRVELWPVVEARASEADTADLSPRSDNATAPHERLARLIAVHAKGLIGNERRASTGELLNAGHFMVLVRRRNAFVRALVRELKHVEIDVAGVDRLNLGEELAIQDLLALARFVLLPQDDLNLACLLKSPLVGLDEQALFELAHGRKGHLWGALRGRSRDPRFAAACARLATWLGRADLATPFDFFAEALGPEGGRLRLLERLGKEAADPIDELLSRALHYQRAETGSLQGFLRWFEAGGGEIKRDLDANRRPEVRILTVHAAKGLQAPIVYLPDTTRVPRGTDRLLVADDGAARLWLPRANDANRAALEWRKRVQTRALEEQNRLLYVALTRAEDRLYIGGWVGATRQDAGCWHERIAAGLNASLDPANQLVGEQTPLRAVKRTFDFTSSIGEAGWEGDGFELVGIGEIAIPEQIELQIPSEAALPSWIRTAAPDEPDPPTPLAPSQPLPDEAAAEPRAFSPLGGADGKRWQRGLLLHDLLRHLPSMAAAERAGLARRFLAQPAHGLTQDEIADWTREALAVTEASDHAALFAEGSRAEVPLIGTVKTPRGSFTVSGQIDRLAVSDREVLIVDYKTNRPPPASADAVALAYRRQLALYRALLQEIYPGRPVRAFLLWTAAPRLMEIDAETLDKSMPYAAAS
jgi:ATP-dependent helicase/nuclease subunit A